MKTITARGRYVVSFNTEMSHCDKADCTDYYELGDSSMYTTDFAGNNIDALAQEVIDNDPKYPMTFHRVEDQGCIVGLFYGSIGSIECPDAIMYDDNYVGPV